MCRTKPALQPPQPALAYTGSSLEPNAPHPSLVELYCVVSSHVRQAQDHATAGRHQDSTYGRAIRESGMAPGRKTPVTRPAHEKDSLPAGAVRIRPVSSALRPTPRAQRGSDVWNRVDRNIPGRHEPAMGAHLGPLCHHVVCEEAVDQPRACRREQGAESSAAFSDESRAHRRRGVSGVPWRSAAQSQRSSEQRAAKATAPAENTHWNSAWELALTYHEGAHRLRNRGERHCAAGGHFCSRRVSWTNREWTRPIQSSTGA